MAYEAGQWNAICDRCGFEFKARQIRKEWTGLRVCDGPGTTGCWEPRHPQESLRGVKDDQSTPWSRPNPPEVYVAARVWDDDAKEWVES